MVFNNVNMPSIINGNSFLNRTDQEERFDYTDDEHDEHGYPMYNRSPSNLKNNISFSNILNNMSGKQQALQIAELLDNEKFAITKTSCPNSLPDKKEQNKDVKYKVNNSIRSVPSGACLVSNIPSNLNNATSGKHKTLLLRDKEINTINDLAQSTPIAHHNTSNMDKFHSDSCLEDQLTINRKATHHLKNTSNPNSTSQENKELKYLVVTLKDALFSIENSQSKNHEEIKVLYQELNQKEAIIGDLTTKLDSYRSTIDKLEKEVTESQQIIKKIEQSKISEIENCKTELHTMKLELRTLSESKQKFNSLKTIFDEISDEYNICKLNSTMDLQTTELFKNEMNSKLNFLKDESVFLSSELEFTKKELKKTQELLNMAQTHLKQGQEISEKNLNDKIIELNNIKAKIEVEKDKNDIDKAGLEVENQKFAQLIIDLQNKLTAQSNEVSGLSTYLKSLICYNVPLGKIIFDLYKSFPDSKLLDPVLLRSEFQIVGFDTVKKLENIENLKDNLGQTSQEFLNLKNEVDTIWKKKVVDLTEEIESIWKKQVSELSNEIDSVWKVQLAYEKNENSKLSKEVIILEEKLLDVSSTNDQLTNNISSMQSEISVLIKEKEDLIDKQAKLSDQIAELKKKQLEDKNHAFIYLSESNQKLINESSSLKQKLGVLEEEAHNIKLLISEKETLLVEKSKIISELELRDHKLSSELQKIKGNVSDMITYESSQRIYHHLNRKIYGSLMIDQVNNMDMVQLQNIVKNCILLLEIPLNKFSKKIPLIGIYLRYEKCLFLHFANRLHELVFHEPIDIRKFTSNAYQQYLDTHDINKIIHPLETCLESLFREVQSKL